MRLEDDFTFYFAPNLRTRQLTLAITPYNYFISLYIIHYICAMPAEDSDKENTPSPETSGGGETQESPVHEKPKGKKKKASPSASTKTVWKSDDDAVLVATLLKEREEGRQSDSGFKPVSYVACAEALKGSEKRSGGPAKTSNSCYDHWRKVHIFLQQYYPVLLTIDV